MTNRIKYSSNNSGGSWWLNDDHWLALEKAGWDVDWVRNWFESWKVTNETKQTGRWLGALATSALAPVGMALEQAEANFERVTGMNVNDVGCECCGPPHSFYRDF